MELEFDLTKQICKSIKLEPVEKLEEERAIIHWISTPDIDRDEDIVDPKGMDDSEFNQTKTVLFNHNYYYPIGHSGWRKKKDEGVLAKSYFSKTPFANDVYTWHKEGVVNSWSISLIPLIKNGVIVEGALEFDDKKRTRTFRKWKLLEYSSVSVPANPNAIDMAKSFTKSLEGLQLIDVASIQLQAEQQLVEYKQVLEELSNMRTHLDELLLLKELNGKYGELEKNILELNNAIETKQQEIKIEAQAETLDHTKIKSIIDLTVREVSQKRLTK